MWADDATTAIAPELLGQLAGAFLVHPLICLSASGVFCAPYNCIFVIPRCLLTPRRHGRDGKSRRRVSLALASRKQATRTGGIMKQVMVLACAVTAVAALCNTAPCHCASSCREYDTIPATYSYLPGPTPSAPLSGRDDFMTT